MSDRLTARPYAAGLAVLVTFEPVVEQLLDALSEADEDDLLEALAALRQARRDLDSDSRNLGPSITTARQMILDAACVDTAVEIDGLSARAFANQLGRAADRTITARITRRVAA